MSEFTQEPSIICWSILHAKTKRYLTLNGTFKVIPYSAKPSREKTFTNWRKIQFLQRNLSCIVSLCPQWTLCPQISRRKLSRKPQNLKIHESFSLYNTFKSYIEAMIPDEFTQKPYMTSKSYNCIHVQYIKPTNKGLCN